MHSYSSQRHHGASRDKRQFGQLSWMYPVQQTVFQLAYNSPLRSTHSFFHSIFAKSINSRKKMMHVHLWKSVNTGNESTAVERGLELYFMHLFLFRTLLEICHRKSWIWQPKEINPNIEIVPKLKNSGGVKIHENSSVIFNHVTQPKVTYAIQN